MTASNQPRRNVFVTSLGTSAYTPVPYDPISGSGEDVDATPRRFVQEARLLALAGRIGRTLDRVIVLRTRTSEQRNWLQAVLPKDETAPAATRPGLKPVLEELGYVWAEPAGTAPSFVDVLIDDFERTEQLWGLYAGLERQIQEGDQVWFDVTHGYRVMPLALTVMLDYLCRVKGATLMEISYGAFEARPKVDGVSAGSAPVFDLAGLLELRSWSDAAAQAAAGDLRPLATLFASHEKEHRRGSHATMSRAVRDLFGATGKALTSLADNLYSARLDELPGSLRAAHTKLSEFQMLAESELPNGPLRPARAAIAPVLRELEAITAQDRRLAQQTAAARWMIGCGLAMQGIILLRETGVAFVAELLRTRGRTTADAERELGALAAWSNPCIGRDEIHGEIVACFDSPGFERNGTLATWCGEVTAIRNAYMHAHTGTSTRNSRQDELLKLADQLNTLLNTLLTVGANP